MERDFSEMSATELWLMAEQALRAGELRTAKRCLDEIGVRFDDAYSRLEERVAAGGQKEVWS